MKLFLILAFILLPIRAHAYLDAGSGSYVLQILLGFLLTGAVFLRMAWGKVTTFFKKIFQSNPK
jgi:hypothetical protein